jgi:hypothetical protein
VCDSIDLFEVLHKVEEDVCLNHALASARNKHVDVNCAVADGWVQQCRAEHGCEVLRRHFVLVFVFGYPVHQYGSL